MLSPCFPTELYLRPFLSSSGTGSPESTHPPLFLFLVYPSSHSSGGFMSHPQDIVSLNLVIPVAHISAQITCLLFLSPRRYLTVSPPRVSIPPHPHTSGVLFSLTHPYHTNSFPLRHVELPFSFLSNCFYNPPESKSQLALHPHHAVGVLHYSCCYTKFSGQVVFPSPPLC